MDYLNLGEAIDLVKSGETVYRPFDNEDGYFTQDWLVKEIIYYYFNDYKYGHIDSDLYGWVDAITEYVGLYEEDYKKWYEEYGEDDDVKHDKMDDYFTYEYVNNYVKETIYIDYEIVDEDDFPEEDDEEDEDDDEECDEVDETTDYDEEN